MTNTSDPPLLAWESASVSFRVPHKDATPGTRKSWLVAVDDVSLSLAAGETLALVGESGSGKSTLVLAALGLVPTTEGRVLFKGQDLAAATRAERRALRERVGVIFQDPYGALNPRKTVLQIVEEPLRVHARALSANARRQRVQLALERVKLSPAEEFAPRLPRELSGGQRQRVAIAASLVCEPDLVIADEPVSMLDLPIRGDILRLLGGLRDQGVGVILVTHDLVSAARFADRIAVLYRGRLAEEGPAARVTASPAHPYTRALLSVVPRRSPGRQERIVLSGEQDSPRPDGGCWFAGRCYMSVEDCLRIQPDLDPVAGDASHRSACLLRDRVSERAIAQHVR